MSARKIEVAHSRGCCTHTAVPAGAGGWDDRRLADQRPHDRRDRVAGRPHHILGRRRQAPAVRRTGVCGRRNRSRRRLSTPPTRWCGKSCRQSRYAASWVLSVCGCLCRSFHPYAAGPTYITRLTAAPSATLITPTSCGRKNPLYAPSIGKSRFVEMFCRTGQLFPERSASETTLAPSANA